MGINTVAVLRVSLTAMHYIISNGHSSINRTNQETLYDILMTFSKIHMKHKSLADTLETVMKCLAFY